MEGRGGESHGGREGKSRCSAARCVNLALVLTWGEMGVV